MDFSKFSSEAFDVKEWINSALSAKKDSNISVDAQASNLVMKLQLGIQEVNKSLEETSMVALNSLPRVLREIESVKTETTLLHNQLQMMKDDIRTVEENTSLSMQRLVEIDEVKERMQGASNALQEADNWSTLSSEVNYIFYSQDIPMVADKLIGMQKSLQVLQDVPDYMERLNLLDSLKNKLEASLSTRLVTTFNNHNLEDAKYYVNIFSELDRLPHLQTYYNNCHKSSLMSTWSEIREDSSRTIATWLPVFYDHLLALWHREISWCGQVFPEPIVAIANLLTQALTNLHPSIKASVNEALHEQDNTLTLIIQLQQITARFVSGIEKAAQTFEGSSYKSMNPSVWKLIKFVQEPFVEFLLRYSQLQQDTLMSGLQAMPLRKLDDLSDTIQSMVESVGQSFTLAEEAKASCFKFTNFYGSTGLLDALQMFFSAYFGQLDGLIVDVRKTCHLTDGNENSVISITTTGDELVELQNAFKLIEMCGDLYLKLASFRELLVSELQTALSSLVRRPMESEGGACNYNYLIEIAPVEWDAQLELLERIESYGSEALLSGVFELVKRLNEHARNLAFDVVFVRLKNFLQCVPTMKEWSMDVEESVAGSLPTFSLSPLGYITQVGDCLLTLPQQLEPFFLHESEALRTALEIGTVPYTDTESQDGADVQWLSGFANGVSKVFQENILKIGSLTEHSTRQLSADIDYFCNILAALEVPSGESLLTIKELLELEEDR